MTDISITPAMIQALMDTAADASGRAYVPYSHFPVGAALLTDNGEIIGGCNVENASYPLSVCAERVAVSNCNCCWPPGDSGGCRDCSQGRCRDALRRVSAGAE